MPVGDAVVHLRTAGVSLLLDLSRGLPRVLHWGADLGSLAGMEPFALGAVFDRPDLPGLGVDSLVPAYSRLGPELVVSSVRLLAAGRPTGLVETAADTLLVEAVDARRGVAFDLAVQLTPAGLVRCRAAVTNTGSIPWPLAGLELALPAGDRADHRLELEGGSLHAVPLGTGRLSAETPLLVGEPVAGFRAGEVWQFLVSFSGSVVHHTERRLGRTWLGGGERLQPGEVELAPGDSYQTPWLVWSWGRGLDAAAHRVHRQLRASGAPSRPVVFDASAEAYAGEDGAGLLALAEHAAAVGVDVFLLDLGWCVRNGLDPYADAGGRSGSAEPADLDEMVARLRELGLGIGLAIPAVPLDLGSARALAEQLAKLIDRYAIEVLSLPLDSDGHRHDGALATYRLLDAIHDRHPQVHLYSTGRDLALASRAGLAARAADSRGRYAELAGLLQQLPPELVWQPVADEAEDQTPAV